jgi:DNA-binding transcriptional ArsR family regulator
MSRHESRRFDLVECDAGRAWRPSTGDFRRGVGQSDRRVTRHRSRHSTKRLTFQIYPIKFNDMVELEVSELDSIFHALGDATRRRMLRDLACGERTVGQLAEPFEISLAAASKHIKALEHAGLIRREVRGRTHVCRLDPGPLASAHRWLSFYERFWTNRLDALERLLRAEDAFLSSPPEGDDP